MNHLRILADKFSRGMNCYFVEIDEGNLIV